MLITQGSLSGNLWAVLYISFGENKFVAHALEKELKTVESVTENDEKEITDRLRGLGYIE